MCPVCGTLLELAESPQAQREKAFIARLIAEGKSKEQIKDALVAEYGDEVLALPRGSGFDLSAYLVPIVAFLVAAVALAFGVAPVAACGCGIRPPTGSGRCRAQRRGQRAARRRPRPLRPLSRPNSGQGSPTTIAPADRALAACAGRSAARGAGGRSPRRRDGGEHRVGLLGQRPPASRRRRRAPGRRGRRGRRRCGASRRVAEALRGRPGSPGRRHGDRRRRRRAGRSPLAAAGPGEDQRLEDLGGVASQRRYSCSPGPGPGPGPPPAAAARGRTRPGPCGGRRRRRRRRARSSRPAPRRR